MKSKSTCGISGPQAKDSLGIIKSGRARWPSSRPYKNDIAGRSPLRLATFSLPTHREVVAAAFRISALGAPQKKPPAPVRSMLRVCIPRRRDYESTYCRRSLTQGGTANKETFMHTLPAKAVSSAAFTWISWVTLRVKCSIPFNAAVAVLIVPPFGMVIGFCFLALLRLRRVP